MKQQKKNFQNNFNVSIIIGNEIIENSNLSIDYYIYKKKKYFYLIKTDCVQLKNMFPIDFIEGIKGFGQHIITYNNFYLVYKVKLSRLELITYDNTIFINGIKKI